MRSRGEKKAYRMFSAAIGFAQSGSSARLMLEPQTAADSEDLVIVFEYAVIAAMSVEASAI